MDICILADTHVGMPGRLNDILWALKKTRQYCLENLISHILILGDLLHDREQVRIEDLNLLVEFLIETEEQGVSIITFPGNHDMYLKNSWDINSLKPLCRYMTVYNGVANFRLDGIRFWVLPFVHYESHYMEILEKLHSKYKDGDVLLTHIGVKSSTLNICFLLKSWSVIDFVDSPFDRIFAGHFHLHQKVGNNLWYPGSPLPFRFDEGDADHGFLVFNTESRDVKFINLWECDDKYKPPQYWTIDDKTIENLDQSLIDNNMIRVALSKEYTHNQLDEIKRILCEMGAREVKWLNLISKEEKESIVAVKTIASADDLFKRFVEADEKGVKNLNVSALLKLNIEITSDGDKRYSTQGYSDEC